MSPNSAVRIRVVRDFWPKTATRRVSQGADVDAERVCEFLQGSEAVRVVGCCERTCLIEANFGHRTSTGIPNAVRFQRHTKRRGELVLRDRSFRRMARMSLLSARGVDRGIALRHHH
jgi:hypothetical protein